jgi:flagellar hook-associated protein 3 FlgL
MSLRVPDAQTFASGDLAIKRTRAKMSEAVRDTSTGKKIHHPWDDPAAAGRAALHTAAAQRLNSVSASAMRARDDLQHADVALGEVGDWLARARELAVQMANDSMSPEDRAHAADEVASLRDGIIDVLNRRVAGRYIFAGNLDNAPPFDPAGNYLGDDGVKRVEVAPGVFEVASVRADEAIKGVAGGVDIFAELSDLELALRTDDALGITDAIEGVDFAHQQVTDTRAEVGTKFVVFDVASIATEALAQENELTSARLTDADLIEAAQNLTMAQTALNAALSASASSFELTLLDKLR